MELYPYDEAAFFIIDAEECSRFVIGQIAIKRLILSFIFPKFSARAANI